MKKDNNTGYTITFLKDVNGTKELISKVIPTYMKKSFIKKFKNNTLPSEEEFNDWYNNYDKDWKGFYVMSYKYINPKGLKEHIKFYLKVPFKAIKFYSLCLKDFYKKHGRKQT